MINPLTAGMQMSSIFLDVNFFNKTKQYSSAI